MFPNNVAVISAERANLSEGVNALRTHQLRIMLEGLSLRYWPVIGKYEGVVENSFMVECPLEQALRLARTFEQDTVLWLDGQNTGLYAADGSYMHPGNLAGMSVNGPETDYYSMVRLGDTLVKFAIPIAFDIKLPVALSLAQ